MKNQYNLEEMLKLYRQHTGLQAYLIDREIRPRMADGADYYDIRFAAVCADRGISSDEIRRAQMESIRSHEECVYTNELGLSYILYSPNLNDMPPGSILAGPFWMEEANVEQLFAACARHQITREELRQGIPDVHAVPVLSQDAVYAGKRLMFYMFSCLNYDAVSVKEDLVQRARIIEVIQHYNQEPIVPPYPYELERKLHMLVKTRDREGAKQVLYELEGYETVYRGDHFPKIRMRFLHLCSLMSRAAMAGGAADAIVCDLADQFMLRICELRTLPEISSCLRESLDAYFSAMFFDVTASNTEMIRKAVSYINNHYDAHLSLKDISEYLHLNPSYFSAVFHQMVGKTFKAYLTQVRMEQSKVLLTTTDYSMLNIALSVGYEDQAYFTKVFREYTGTTPAQYRQKLH